MGSRGSPPSPSAQIPSRLCWPSWGRAIRTSSPPNWWPKHSAFARAALTDYGGIVLAQSMDAAVDFVNQYAPEHLQIAVRDPQGVLARIRNAGEILLGQDTPFSAGNYAIGVPAALPTGGAARTGSG